MRRASRPGSAASLAATVLMILLVCVVPVASQAVDPDLINFSTMAEWKDLRFCVQCILQECSLEHILYVIGCETNACICRGSTLGDAAPKLSKMALSRCNNLNDATIATSILIAYCLAKGYTELVHPTVLQTTTTGVYTITVTKAAITVVQTRVVNVAAVRIPGNSGSIPPYLIPTLATVLATCAAPLFWPQSQSRVCM
ncbi:hypothetical protein OQA88_2990 [Cercophora sp. LCS_1]